MRTDPTDRISPEKLIDWILPDEKLTDIREIVTIERGEPFRDANPAEEERDRTKTKKVSQVGRTGVKMTKKGKVDMRTKLAAELSASQRQAIEPQHKIVGKKNTAPDQISRSNKVWERSDKEAISIELSTSANESDNNALGCEANEALTSLPQAAQIAAIWTEQRLAKLEERNVMLETQ